MRATVICPTYNHGPLIKHALRSVLNQTHQDFEIFVIGDGVPDTVHGDVEEAVGMDPRITFIDRPKSKRHGEEYRHEVLDELATGEVVFYISDDDLWFPDHLKKLITLLTENDIAHSVPCSLLTDSKFWFSSANWSDPIWRSWTLDPPFKNVISLSVVAHRMNFYRTLPHGWRTSPKDVATDHYMWIQMLSMPRSRAVGLDECSVIKFDSPSRERENMTDADRLAELHSWELSLQDNPIAVKQYITLQKATWDRSQVALGHRLYPIVHDLRKRLEKSEEGNTELQELKREIDKKRQRIVELKAQLTSVKLKARKLSEKNQRVKKEKLKWYKRIFR